MDFLGVAFFGFSFLLAVVAIKLISDKHRKRGLLGIDINKPGEKKIPESVGIALLVPVWICSIIFYFITGSVLAVSWAVMVSAFSMVGYVDDTSPKFDPVKNGKGKRTKWIYRAGFIALISLGFSALFFTEPLMIIVAALFLAGYASFENTFAGLNGWEIGSGFILSAFLAYIFFTFGLIQLPLVLVLSGAILALLTFNFFPAKVFPGDSGTLLIGSALAGIIIWTKDINLMIVGFLFLIPHFIDFAAKMLSNPNDPSQRKTRPYAVLANGKLGMQEKGKYDFAKIVIHIFGPVSERRLVFIIWLIVIANCVLVSICFLPELL